MTTKARPQFYFSGIKFNSSYYDTVIDDSIPPPINQATAQINSVLTLTNQQPIQTSWITIPTQITNYVNYNNTTNILNSSISGTVTDLVIANGIGSSFSQKFKLPTAIPSFIGAMLRVTSISPIQTEWSNITVVSPHVTYDGTTDQLINNNAFGSSNITDLVLSSVGLSMTEKFVLPSNCSTSTVGQVLSILNATTKTTQWITIPTQITNYVNYDSVNSNLISNVSGIPTTINSISIGGLLTCTGVDSGSALIQTTGEVKSRLLTIQNNAIRQQRLLQYRQQVW